MGASTTGRWWLDVRGLDAESDGFISSGYHNQPPVSSGCSEYSWLSPRDDGDTCTPVPEESSPSVSEAEEWSELCGVVS